MKKQNFFFVITGLGCILFFSCSSNDLSSHDVAFEKHQVKNLENGNVKRWLEQLTSPKFFEYTQAARKFLDMGIEAIPYLRENIHLMRESNDSVIPVCLNLLEIIFQQQKEEWILSQIQSSYPEIQKIAQEEIIRRKKK